MLLVVLTLRCVPQHATQIMLFRRVTGHARTMLRAPDRQ